MPSSDLEPIYDVFLSHEHADGPIVEEVASHLTEQGFRVWLDTWELVPGAPAESAIDDALARTRVFAACIGAQRSSWAERELRAALEMQSGSDLEVVAVLLPGADPAALPPEMSGKPAIDLNGGATPQALKPLVEALSAARRGTAAPAGAQEESGLVPKIDYRQIISEADEALRKDPEDVDALKRRLFARRALGRYQGALADVDRLLEARPEELAVYTQKAEILRGLGRTEAVYEVVSLLDEKAPQLVDEMIKTYAELDDESIEAIGRSVSQSLELANLFAFRRLTAALKSDRDTAIRRVRAEASVIGAQAALGADPEKALQYWRRAVELDPESVASTVGLISAVSQSGDKQEMERLLAEFEHAGDAPTVLAARALGRLAQGRADESLDLLARAVDLNGEDPVLRVLRSNLLTGLGRLEEAAADLRVVLDDNPANWKLTAQLIALYRHAGRLDDVADLIEVIADRLEPALRSLFGRAGEADGQQPAFLEDKTTLEELRVQHRVMAEVMRAKADWSRDERRQALERAFAIVCRWPEQYVAWVSAVEMLAQEPDLGKMVTDDAKPAWVGTMWRACLAWLGGDGEEGLARFDEVLEQEPELGVARMLRAGVLADAGDPVSALEELDRVIEIDPYAPSPRAVRGRLRGNLGQLEEALEDYDQVIDVLKAAGEPEIYFGRGEARRQLGRYREAIEDFDVALRLPMSNPGLGPVVVGSRGEAKLGLGDFDGALSDLDAALEKDPTLAWALGSRALVHLAKEDVEAALADRQRYASLVPGDPNGWRAYGQLLLQAGQAEKAWAELTAALEADDAHFANLALLLGQAAIETGRFEESEEVFRRAADLKPEEDFYRYEQARAMRHQGRTDEAAELVEEALEHVRERATAPDAAWYVRFNLCLYLLAAARDDEALRAYRELLAELTDVEAAKTGLRELAQLEASGYRSEAVESAKASVEEWLEAHRAA